LRTASAFDNHFALGENYMKKLLLLATVTAGLNLALISSAGAQTFGGYATGAQVTVTATGTTIRAATGTLPASGGGVDASLLVGTIPGSATGGVVSLSAGVMHSAASGITATRAEASMADIALTVSGNQITAAFLMARSRAACAPAAAGSSEVANLVINGQSIVVTGAPNQTVALPNGTAVINEQFPNVSGTSAALNVNALHVRTNDPITGQPVADVLLGTISAEIQCVGGAPSTATDTTGGGWITLPTSGKATFGFVGQMEGGTASGHLEYNDHDFPLTLHSTQILTVTTTACSTTITGTATAGGAFTGQVTFRLDVTDNGEPGKDNDVFTISADELAYSRTGPTISGGNIQVHERTCP
jgi:hypothetical protein